MLYQLNYWRVYLILPRLPMERMVTAPLAILLELDAIGVVLLVLLRRVVAALAFSACQCDQRTHLNCSSYLLSQSAE